MWSNVSMPNKKNVRLYFYKQFYIFISLDDRHVYHGIIITYNNNRYYED